MHYTIQFNFALDGGRLEVLLEADIEQDPQGSYFIVKNFRMPGKTTAILPEIGIKKTKGHWVHRDSGWQTTLSESVGKAIEKVFATPADSDGRPQSN